MSVSKWAYDPGLCDGGPCVGECDICHIAEKRIKAREFIHIKNDLVSRLNQCYTDKDGTIHLADNTLDAAINFISIFWEGFENVEK